MFELAGIVGKHLTPEALTRLPLYCSARGTTPSVRAARPA